MITQIFDNYEAFYNMLLSVTMLSNSQADELEADGKQLIDFIGKAYKLSDELIDECQKMIFDVLSPLALTSDQLAIYSSREAGALFSERDALFDIKGDVLGALQAIGSSEAQFINPSWFDYTHYKSYESHVRFAKIKATSASGNIATTREVGLLEMLGIGCEKNEKDGMKRLFQCVTWGDIPSMYMLAYAYDVTGDAEKSKLFYEIAQLSSKYLLSGFTVLGDDVKKRYSESACAFYVYISSIWQDIVIAYNKKNIDFSFVEAITSDKLDYFDRMNYINDYNSKSWKNVTNSSEKPAQKFGFK